MRLAQGLGVGAQWGGAALLLTEYAPVARRGFYGSLIQAGAILGAVAGNVVFLLLTERLPEQQFVAWGWRVPFLAGLLLVLIGVYVQFKLEESPVFLAMRARTTAVAPKSGPLKGPLREALMRHRRQVLQAAGAVFLANATFYILSSGMLSYGVKYLRLPNSLILGCVLVAGATELLTIPLFGTLSDRWGRRRLVLAGAVLTAAFAYPMFWLVDSGSATVILLALVVAFTVHAMMYGPLAALYAEMFPADVRYSGASLGYQIAAVFGGLAPFVMTALLAATGAPWSVSLYIIAMSAVTFLAVFGIRERFRRDLHETSG
jgi:MFS family permease